MLLLTASVAVTILVNDARAIARWSDLRSASIEPALQFVAAVQRERTTSVRMLAGGANTAAPLPDQRAQTDAQLAAIGQVSVAAGHQFDELKNAQSLAQFGRLAPQIPTIRASVDRGEIPVSDVNAFYSQLIGALADNVVETAGAYAPNNRAVIEELSSAMMLRIADMHSQAVGLTTSQFTESTVDPARARIVAALYTDARQQLNTESAQFAGPTRDALDRLQRSPEWLMATTGENQLLEQGWLAVPYGEWLANEEVVNAQLLDMFHTQVVVAARTAEDAASTSADRSIWVGVGVLLLTIATSALTVVLARRLATRLRMLQSRSLELAQDTLPSLIARIQAGEAIDLDAQISVAPAGGDEIDQVARAFAIAQRTAVTVAVDQTRTRSGFAAVFLDIAYRNQSVVRQQLEILDLAESKQNDPEHLQLLFDLDHLTTRARRNAENLLILGGGQPGRRWRQPVPLEDIVRAAVSETEALARVGTVRVADVLVTGSVVTDLIHLLAELIDNAANFSPPTASVSIHGNAVGRGVVVEVEDQGLGIRFEERERLNETLSNSPDFHEMALKGRRHLGLFVVSRLAQRHSITVNLQESAYGGIKSIVLLPTEILQTPLVTADPEVAVNISERIRPHTRTISPIPQAELSKQTGSFQQPATTTDHTNGRKRMRIDNGVPADRPLLPSAGSTPQVTRGRAPLPRRERQSHMAPELGRTQFDPRAQPEPLARRRSAEVARGSMASFQSGTRQGRASAPDTQ
ncbi:nitrate- and nitrite sensing domain-containing protein [Nocardia sp. NPDC005366]|uniref:sensor histidine kinase n=1 Tax=Nocardia sp. NPDC005366 TaxID=3156878 RepID=UPI0033BD421F